MKMRSSAPIRAAKIGNILLSAMTSVLGIVLVVFPGVSSEVMMRILGAEAILFGAAKIAGYFSKDLYRLAFQFDLELGIALIAIGTVALLHPVKTLGMMTEAVGLFTLIDGLFKSKIALEAKRFGLSYWWSIMAFGIISCVIGAGVIARPSESVAVMTVLTGISLIADGVMNLTVALETVKIIKRQYPDVIDPEYEETVETEDTLR